MHRFSDVLLLHGSLCAAGEEVRAELWSSVVLREEVHGSLRKHVQLRGRRGTVGFGHQSGLRSSVAEIQQLSRPDLY